MLRRISLDAKDKCFVVLPLHLVGVSVWCPRLPNVGEHLPNVGEHLPNVRELLVRSFLNVRAFLLFSKTREHLKCSRAYVESTRAVPQYYFYMISYIRHFYVTLWYVFGSWARRAREHLKSRTCVFGVKIWDTKISDKNSRTFTNKNSRTFAKCSPTFGVIWDTIVARKNFDKKSGWLARDVRR
jgi:hypothetical protein